MTESEVLEMACEAARERGIMLAYPRESEKNPGLRIATFWWVSRTRPGLKVSSGFFYEPARLGQPRSEVYIGDEAYIKGQIDAALLDVQNYEKFPTEFANA